MEDPEISAHLARVAKSEHDALERARQREERHAIHLGVMRERLAARLGAEVVPVLEAAAAQLVAGGYQAAVTFAPDLPGGPDGRALWIVASVLLECRTGAHARQLFDLKFLGEVDAGQDLWRVRSYTLGVAPGLPPDETFDPGQGGSLKDFAAARLRAFVKAIIPLS